MRGWFLAALIVAGVIALFYLLNSVGLLFSLNETVNKLVAGSPNTKCNVDSDCALRTTNCEPCNCDLVYANKNWKVFCPFRSTVRTSCEMCTPPDHNFEIKCVGGECQKVLKQS